LHIISLTVPYPVDYGGVFDLFYKLPALHALGIKIHLHCFDYGRGQQPELEKYCLSVDYYSRNQGFEMFLNRQPYVVVSRKNETLLANLLQDDHPILMEGIHSTALFADARFNDRKKFVRLHNVEYKYYDSLYENANKLFKKIYYLRESRLLKNFEALVAQNATALFTVTPHDKAVYEAEFHSKNAEYLPLFLPPSWQPQGIPGMGTYCLYHGDLGVEMNEEAAIWLLQQVFSKIPMPLVIAGKNPSQRLQKISDQNQQTCIVGNPSEEIMQDMIAKAHINILPSFSNTGIKIKLLNALFNGRHCIVTPPTVEGTGLEALCHITNNAEAMVARIEGLYQQPYSTSEMAGRAHILHQLFGNETNAQKLVARIWG